MWVGTTKTKLWGGRLDSTSVHIPNSLTTKQAKTNDISKQQSKQAIRQAGEVEENYKMFANPVFITPGRYSYLVYTKTVDSVFRAL